MSFKMKLKRERGDKKLRKIQEDLDAVGAPPLEPRRGWDLGQIVALSLKVKLKRETGDKKLRKLSNGELRWAEVS